MAIKIVHREVAVARLILGRKVGKDPMKTAGTPTPREGTPAVVDMETVRLATAMSTNNNNKINSQRK